MNKVISADSHVQEPPELYERIPKALRHRAPRIVERDGARYLVVDGRRPRRLDVADARVTDDDRDREFRDDPSGGRDIDRRLADLARDGVSAEVIYPNQSLGLFMSPAPDYQLAVAKAWNDCEARLPVDQGADHQSRATLQPPGVRAAVGGHRGHRNGARVPCLHQLRGHLPRGLGEEEGIGGALDFMAMRMADGLNPVSQLISGGVCERHPNLDFVVVECGAGWLRGCCSARRAGGEEAHVDPPAP